MWQHDQREVLLAGAVARHGQDRLDRLAVAGRVVHHRHRVEHRILQRFIVIGDAPDAATDGVEQIPGLCLAGRGGAEHDLLARIVGAGDIDVALAIGFFEQTLDLLEARVEEHARLAALGNGHAI